MSALWGHSIPQHLVGSGVGHRAAPTPLLPCTGCTGTGTQLAPHHSRDLCDCPVHNYILQVMCAASPAMSCPLPPPTPGPKLHFGEGRGGLCAPLRHGDALPMPAAPQPHTLPYNALFMRSGRLSSEMPLQSSAVPVPAVTLAMRVLSQHGTASLPALA